jgi:hypothetical protein
LQHFLPRVDTKDIRIEKTLGRGIFRPIVDDPNFNPNQFGYSGYGFGEPGLPASLTPPDVRGTIQPL